MEIKVQLAIQTLHFIVFFFQTKTFVYLFSNNKQYSNFQSIPIDFRKDARNSVHFEGLIFFGFRIFLTSFNSLSNVLMAVKTYVLCFFRLNQHSKYGMLPYSSLNAWISFLEISLVSVDGLKVVMIITLTSSLKYFQIVFI